MVFFGQFQEQLQRKLDYKVAQEYDDEVLESFHLVMLVTLTDQLPDGHRQRRNKFINILSNFDQLLIS